MLFTEGDLLELLLKASKKDEKKDDKKKDKKPKCSCNKKRRRGGKKKIPFHEQLAMTIFFAPFVLMLPFLFQTFNLLFLFTSSWYIQYAQWTLETAKQLPH
jgi:hypothetical protein